MNIGIDVDGVLADANAATLPLVERYTGTHIEKDEITHWDYVSDTTGLSVWHFVRLMGQAWKILRICRLRSQLLPIHSLN